MWYVLGGGPSLAAFSAPDTDQVVACNSSAWRITRGHVAVMDEWWAEKFAGRVADHAADCPGIRWTFVRLNRRWPVPEPWRGVHVTNEWTSRVEDGLRHAGNVGLPALHLASLLTDGPIVMAGFDMEAAPDGLTANWHDDYPESRRVAGACYDRMVGTFRDRVPDSVKSRVTVIGPSRLSEAGFRVVEPQSWAQ